MRASLAASEVRHAGMFTPEQLHLMAALNRAGIAYLSEQYFLSDIWAPAHQSLKEFRVDILIKGFLVVEVDGKIHEIGRHPENDRRRDAWFLSKGYRVVRFTNRRVMRETDAVVEEIRREMGR